MGKTNDAGVPFLSGKRKVTDKYRENYDQIDWSKKSSKDEDNKSSEDSRKEKSDGEI